MKKLLFCLVGLVLMGTVAMSQPVHDNAVVPIGVTLNQILRLNILTGGNIEFVFTNIDQYEVGIGGAEYTTTMTVSASQSWDMEWVTDETTLIGDGSTIALDNVGIYIIPTGNHGSPAELSIEYYSSAQNAGDMTSTEENIIEADGTGNGGDAADNAFTIYWLCGTGDGTMNGTSFIDQDYEPGRYSTNVIFTIMNGTP